MAACAAKTYTLAEVKQHGSKQSCWIVIRNKVYDVTPWLKSHPGGADVLIDNGGMYATKAFDDVGHSKDAHAMLPKYYIGDMVEADHEPEKKKKK